ncbi:MAG: diguanylate cyclase, partial [Gammaproteobacteria bacterium]|nr:diguanylate cyclase [Gammaproteobacteria bacterium]
MRIERGTWVRATLSAFSFAGALVAVLLAFVVFYVIELFVLQQESPNYQRFYIFLALALLIALIVRLHAHILWRKILSFVQTPLNALSRSFEQISQEHDYSIRAPDPQQRDFVEVYERFNEVLADMQHREQDLVADGQNLSEQVGKLSVRLRKQSMRLDREIAKRRRAQEEMVKLSSALTQAADAVMVTNRSGIIEYVNPAFEAITGYTRDAVLGKQPSILRSDEQDPAIFEQMWQTILEGRIFRAELVNLRRDGTTYHEEKTITPLKDSHGEITHFIATGKDISDRIKVQEKLEYMAHYDSITGLPNRVLLLDRIEQGITRSKRNSKGVAILFIDLDGFKAINDTVGHHVGDRFLGEVAARLQSSIRDNDTVARLGGDEFAVVLEDLQTMTDISKVARKVMSDLAAPFYINDKDLYVSGSIGIARYPVDGEDVHTLLRKADNAMYRAKQSGKNTYRFYSQVEGEADALRLELEQELRRAVERQEFVLYYQPQVSIDTSTVVGVEALLRWQHPTRGIIMPDRFIPALEETGMIIDVGDWVLRQACLHAKEWRNAGLPLIRVAVNLSSRQFAKHD